MKYTDIQQRRRRAEKLINRAMRHAKEGNTGSCAALMAQAGNELQLISAGIGTRTKANDYAGK
ncbi:hypothetical protein NLN82_23330 [Citrobacter portucalensis]|uniref:hypothetical protein n=1 Tax=Citrobacter portucalensis TaxID=1639133 RepID=UPI00226BBC95|nr:hypothetical protein [Citrobacter portucalensis]MCX9038961.1 hypothetical protein [Citrobacter portucalensis]